MIELKRKRGLMKYTPPFEVSVKTYDEALLRIHEVLRFGICPMLETVEDMLEELGNPDLCFSSVQIAGTNGKTSTSRYCTAFLRACGKKVALYTSPHLVEYTERLEINGVPVSKELFALGITYADVAGKRVNARREQAGLRPYDITEFDLITVASAFICAYVGVDICVLEVGLGGRWDATSALKNISTVCITGIGLDHVHILGDTLSQIASEKAAIIKRGRNVILGAGTLPNKETLDVFLNACASQDVDPYFVLPQIQTDAAGLVLSDVEVQRLEKLYPECISRFSVLEGMNSANQSLTFVYQGFGGNSEVFSVLQPNYQAINISVALTVAQIHLNQTFGKEVAQKALDSTPIPGRFEFVQNNPAWIIDACHNPQSVEVFLESLRALYPNKDDRPILLCAILKDKDSASMVKTLAKEFPRVCTTQTVSPRALSVKELSDEFTQAGVSVVGKYPNVKEAVEGLKNSSVVALGSITLAGEVREQFLFARPK